MTSFVTALGNYIAYQRFHGIYPVTIRDDYLEPSKWLRAISLIASLALVTFAFSIKYTTTDDGVLAVVVEAVSMLAMLGVATALASSAVHTQKLCDAFRALHEADLILKAHGIQPKLSSYVLFAWAWIGFAYTLAAITLILEIFFPLWVLTGTIRWFLVEFYFTLLMLILSNLTFLELSAAWRFRVINEKLRKICSDIRRQSILLTLSLGKYGKVNPAWTTSLALEGSASAAFLKICVDLQKCHILVSNACLDLLSVFAVPCFLSLGHSTTELCCNAYKTLALPMVHQMSLNFIIVFNSCKWGLLSLARFALVVGPFSYVAFEANNTLGIILELQSQIKDSQMRRQLDSFALQLIRPLEFRPLSVFTLNMGLLLGMLGTVATYVVILLQLHAAAPNIEVYVRE